MWARFETTDAEDDMIRLESQIPTFRPAPISKMNKDTKNTKNAKSKKTKYYREDQTDPYNIPFVKKISFCSLFNDTM